MQDNILQKTIWGNGYVPEPVRRTRDAKYEIIGMIQWMRQNIDQIENRVRCTPETNDEKHAELVERWAMLINEADNMLQELATYGII